MGLQKKAVTMMEGRLYQILAIKTQSLMWHMIMYFRYLRRTLAKLTIKTHWITYVTQFTVIFSKRRKISTFWIEPSVHPHCSGEDCIWKTQNKNIYGFLSFWAKNYGGSLRDFPKNIRFYPLFQWSQIIKCGQVAFSRSGAQCAPPHSGCANKLENPLPRLG